MSDFLDELQDDMQQEKFLQLWKQYGKYLIVSCLVFLCGTGAYVFWSHQEKLKLEDLSIQYEQALTYFEDNRPDDALKILENLEKTPTGYSVLAKLQKASYRVKQAITSDQDFTQVKKIYQDIAYNPSFQPLAMISLAYTLATVHQRDPEVDKIIEAYETPHHPWKGLSLEVQALNAYHAHENVHQIYTRLLQSRDIPSVLKSRAALENMGAGFSSGSAKFSGEGQ